MTAREPCFVAVGTWVEDRRDNRPDICRVFCEGENVGVHHGGGAAIRSYEEACKLAQQIAHALNVIYPNANNPPRARKVKAL